MSKKNKQFSRTEIKKREADLAINVIRLDAKNLGDLRSRQPEIVSNIEGLLEVGATADDIGWVVRRQNPQMWVESKFAESVARALIAEAE